MTKVLRHSLLLKTKSRYRAHPGQQFSNSAVRSCCCCLVPWVNVKKNVIVAITSDKGLYDGINSTSVKVSKTLHKMTSCNLVHGYLLLFIWLVLRTMAYNSSNQVQRKKVSMSS